jgi:DNA excision repair protein ERCC-4
MRKALPSGDYSILGHETTFTVERKSLTDLLGCIFTDRFERELDRLRLYRFAFLAIEANLRDIRNPQFYKGNPAAVIGKLRAIELRYGVRVKYLGDREESQEYVKGLLNHYARQILKNGGESPCEQETGINLS